jgi:hypothetical protein
VDVAEQIKWFDVLELLNLRNIVEAVEAARMCLHPDAQWLASLFPVGVLSTWHTKAVLLDQGDDARALYFAWLLGDRHSQALLARSAVLGFAPAQAFLSLLVRDASSRMRFEFAERSVLQGDRRGLHRLATCLEEGIGCVVDMPRAIELHKRSAECQARYSYGKLAFGEYDWERYLWWGLEVDRSHYVRVFSLLSFVCCPRSNEPSWGECCTP